MSNLTWLDKFQRLYRDSAMRTEAMVRLISEFEATTKKADFDCMVELVIDKMARLPLKGK